MESFPYLTPQDKKVYLVIMCFWNVHIQTTGHDRQRTHWHGLATADNTQSPEAFTYDLDGNLR